MPCVTSSDNQSNFMFTQENQLKYQLKAQTTNFEYVSSSPLKSVAFKKLNPAGNKNFDSITKEKLEVKENRSFSMHRLMYPTMSKELSSDEGIDEFNDYHDFNSNSNTNNIQKQSMVNNQESK